MTRNKENLNAWQRAYYQKRKSDTEYVARRKASARKYYKKKKEQILARHKKYHKENLDSYRAYRRNYRRLNPRGIFSALKDGAKKRNLQVTMTIDQFVCWWESQHKICFYCKRTLEEITHHSDSINNRAKRFTIDRADSKKPYSLKNIRLACYRCNCVKGDYFSESEMLKIGKIIHAKQLD